MRYRTWDDRLRPWDFAAFLHEKRRDFSGREWLFAQIEQWRLHRDERALLITGDPGVGKSAIVAELVHRNPGGQVLAYHCCQATTPETLRPDRFVRSLAAMIASKLPAYAGRLSTPAIEENLCRDAVILAFTAVGLGCGRNTYRYRAKAVTPTSIDSAPEHATDPRLQFLGLWFSEQSLENEHREWLRLMLEAEWFA